MGRYQKQALVLGKEAQAKLQNSLVAIVGLGALGTVSANLLCRAGVGHLVLVDRDLVELDNLQRQVLFDEGDISKPKAIRVAEKLRKINSEIKIESYFENLDQDTIDLLDTDLVLDCTDNLETRFLINDYCKKNKKPWIFASAIKQAGFVYVIAPKKPCFRCIFKEASLETCETTGVLNAITMQVGAIQSNEAIKLLVDAEVEQDLLFINLTKNKIEKIKVKKNKDCLTCNGVFNYLTAGKKDITKFCGSGTFLIKGSFDFNEVKARLKKNFNIKESEGVFYFSNLTVFKDKVLIKAKTEKEARSLYSKYIGN